jgi:hypothetical protein
MAKVRIGRRAFVVAGLLLGGVGATGPATGQELSETAKQQIGAILAEKAARTPTQRKLATSLLMAHRESMGQAMVQGLQKFRRTADRARVDRRGLVIVDIRADVTDGLLQAITTAGGAVLGSYPGFGMVRAEVPIRQVEAIAALPEVRHIGPREGFLVNTGSQTSQGDAAHAAASARTTFGVNGTGIKVGVLSDGVDSLLARQATGDLPATCAPTPGPGACVTVVSGQAGSGDEGTAMLEIVHDLAPGAKLYFATAVNGAASFAANILALRNTYGCDIIVDDITYFNEGAFQDGVIAQAVNTVRSGALFFSSAGNSGRASAATSGTWEGDFKNSLTTIPVFNGSDWQGLPVHSFNGLTGGGAANTNPLTADADVAISLKWSDPLAGAVTDYDLFLLDSALANVLDFSINDQTVGGLDPFEIMGFGLTGERIVVVNWAGPAKALRLDTNRGRLSIATDGAVVGHNGGDGTISVAAANVSSAGGGAFTGGAANPVASYSSDGPRHMFFNPNGTAITPGNLLFATSGGRELQKPDITAADCVTTTTPGFIPFCGTSAAAPHAAGIAAVLMSTANRPSGGQVLAAMFGTALDVNPPGRDRDAGVGIPMANLAGTALATIPAVDFFTVTPCRVFDTRSATGPTTGAPLACGGDRDFTIVGGTCGIPSGAKAVSVNVTVTGPSAAGNLRLFASGAPSPVVSALNYAAGQTRGNNAIAPLSSAGQMAVRCSPSGTAHVILDVNGYFQ